MPAKHCKCPTTPHERVLDIREHDDTRAIQRPKRRCQIDTRHLLKPRETRGDIAALIIDHTRAQRLQHAGATVVGGTAAQTNIDSLCPSTNRSKHELAHAIGRSGQRRRLCARRIPNTRRLGHLDYSRLVLAVHQHPGRHTVAQRACDFTCHDLTAARGNGIERSLTAIRQRQRAYLGIGPHAAHTFGNGLLRLRARNAALKGVDRQLHTAGPAARGTKIDRPNGSIFDTRKRLGVGGMRLKIGPTTAASTIGATQPTKITAQHRAALVCQHAGGHIKPMIQARIGIEVV